MRRFGVVVAGAALVATAVAAALAVGAIGGSGGGAQAAAEGIQVHGHWTIEVRDPDGTVAERREFENALVNSGREQLVDVLTRARTPGEWIVHLVGGVSQPCASSSDVPLPCVVGESTWDAAGAHVFKTLTVSSGTTTFELEGTAVAARNGEISQVRTLQRSCPATVEPAGCIGDAATDAEFITTKQLSAAVSVQEAQQILVRVEISFS